MFEIPAAEVIQHIPHFNMTKKIQGQIKMLWIDSV